MHRQIPIGVAPILLGVWPLTASAGTSTTSVSSAELELLSAVTTPTSLSAGPVSSINLSLLLDAALMYVSEELELRGGAHDPGNGFTLQQLELHGDANVDPYFRLDANIVFSPEEIDLEEAYATTLALPGGLQARAGRFLARFGRVNSRHPHAWAFATQALPIGRYFGEEGARGVGIELSWLTPLPWYVELVGGTTMLPEESPSFASPEDVPFRDPSDLLYTAALRQFAPFDEDWSLAFGFSGAWGKNTPEAWTSVYGFDAYLRFRPVDSEARRALGLVVELFLRRRASFADVVLDGGGYAELVAELDPEWQVAGRVEHLFGAAENELPEDRAERTRGTLAVSYRPSHFARVRLQGGADAPGDELVYHVGVQLEVLIGAHGAHEY